MFDERGEKGNILITQPTTCGNQSRRADSVNCIEPAGCCERPLICWAMHSEHSLQNRRDNSVVNPEFDFWEALAIG